VVFSMDWLDIAELSPSNQPFCIAGTPGAELVNGLEVDRLRDLIFTKNLDDVFNTNTKRPDGPGNFIHGFGLRNEGKNMGASSNQLVDLLAKLGYHSENSIITVVGILTDMCVLKSAMHARDLGFEVQVVRQATHTSNTGPPTANWSLPPPKDIKTVLDKWQRAVYTYGDRDNCGAEWAYAYMEAAGIQVV